MKTQWHNSWAVWAKRDVVSYRIGKRPWRLFSQPTPFITFWQVLINNTWTSNKQYEKKNKNKKQLNVEHGEENVQVKPHACVHRWVDRIEV